MRLRLNGRRSAQCRIGWGITAETLHNCCGSETLFADRRTANRARGVGPLNCTGNEKGNKSGFATTWES
jgi:hypothetical protein